MAYKDSWTSSVWSYDTGTTTLKHSTSEASTHQFRLLNGGIDTNGGDQPFTHVWLKITDIEDSIVPWKMQASISPSGKSGYNVASIGLWYTSPAPRTRAFSSIKLLAHGRRML